MRNFAGEIEDWISGGCYCMKIVSGRGRGLENDECDVTIRTKVDIEAASLVEGREFCPRLDDSFARQSFLSTLQSTCTEMPSLFIEKGADCLYFSSKCNK